MDLTGVPLPPARRSLQERQQDYFRVKARIFATPDTAQSREGGQDSPQGERPLAAHFRHPAGGNCVTAALLPMREELLCQLHSSEDMEHCAMVAKCCQQRSKGVKAFFRTTIGPVYITCCRSVSPGPICVAMSGGCHECAAFMQIKERCTRRRMECTAGGPREAIRAARGAHPGARAALRAARGRGTPAAAARRRCCATGTLSGATPTFGASTCSARRPLETWLYPCQCWARLCSCQQAVGVRYGVYIYASHAWMRAERRRGQP